jgi:hypothetical protein
VTRDDHKIIPLFTDRIKNTQDVDIKRFLVVGRRESNRHPTTTHNILKLHILPLLYLCRMDNQIGTPYLTLPCVNQYQTITTNMIIVQRIRGKSHILHVTTIKTNKYDNYSPGR